MPNSRKPPKYFKYFDAVHEDHPVDQLPEELQSCGDCGNWHQGCHMLVGGKRGRKRGIAAVVIVHCSQCRSVHLTQVFVNDRDVGGLDAPVLRAIAKDLGLGSSPRARRSGAGPQP